jgi:hypothetical protein
MVWVEKFADVIKKMNSTIEERHHDWYHTAQKKADMKQLKVREYAKLLIQS